jgi:hypothetical protein
MIQIGTEFSKASDTRFRYFKSYFCCQKNKVKKSLLLLITQKVFNEAKSHKIITDSHQDFSAQPTFSRSKLLLKPQKEPT